MTVVVGIDTASARFHWVASEPILDGFDTHLYREYGWFRMAVDAESARLELYRAAKRFFRVLPQRAHVYVEEPLAIPKNGQTTKVLCMAAGAIWCAFMETEPDAYWHWVDVAEWKKKILGRGAPPRGQKHKPWIRETILNDERFTYEQAAFDNQPDLYDAWAICQFGLLEIPKLTSPGQ